eukprot:COSAG02_NODE_5633_length_4170_cov_2.964628_6_plen_359_part_01
MTGAGTVGACTTCPENTNAAHAGATSSSECTVNATEFACSEFACEFGLLTSSAVVGFPDPASAYCAGTACNFGSMPSPNFDDDLDLADFAVLDNAAACAAPTTSSGSSIIEFTGGYVHNQDCTWVVHCAGVSPKMSFSSMNTEADWDFVYAYDPETNEQLTKVSGMASPSDIVSPSSSIMVRFTSDGSVARDGFAASIACPNDVQVCCTIATCNAFETTFPTAPAGFVAIDASATTVDGVGLSCDADAHYTGTAVLTCDGTTFSSPTGCVPRDQCGSSPACPAGYEAATDASASYCAGTTCDLDDDVADADDDEAYAHDLDTCCQLATCTPFSSTFTSTPTGYTATDASATTVDGVGLS